MAGWSWLAAAALALSAAAAGSAERSLDALRPEALGGDGEAAYRLGRAYKTGEGVPADLGEAERWFEIAARKGHAKAGAELGLVRYQSGKTAAALPWLRKAADAGDPRAQYTLATILFAGKGASMDPDGARLWMRKAAGAGLPAAKEAMAVMDKQPEVAALAPERRQELPTKPFSPISAGQWQVQVGAFAIAKNAHDYWRKLQDGKGRGLQASFPVRGRLTLLRLGPFADRETAGQFCTELRKIGRDCVEVAADKAGQE